MRISSRSSSRHVRSDAPPSGIQERTRKVSRKNGYCARSRRNSTRKCSAAAKFVRALSYLERPQVTLFVSLFATLFASKYINVYWLRSLFGIRKSSTTKTTRRDFVNRYTIEYRYRWSMIKSNVENNFYLSPRKLLCDLCILICFISILYSFKSVSVALYKKKKIQFLH